MTSDSSYPTVKKEGGITYDSTLVHLKRNDAIVSILPICQGCGQKLEYEDIETREGIDNTPCPDGEGGFIKWAYGTERCTHCGYEIGSWDDPIPCDAEGNEILSSPTKVKEVNEE